MKSWGSQYDRKAALASLVEDLTLCEYEHSYEKTEEFANDCHSKKDGRFCKGTGSGFGKVIKKGKAAVTRGKTSIKKPPGPTPERAAVITTRRSEIKARVDVIDLKRAEIRRIGTGYLSGEPGPRNPNYSTYLGLAAEKSALMQEDERLRLELNPPTTGTQPDPEKSPQTSTPEPKIPGGYTCDGLAAEIRHQIEQIDEGSSGVFQSPEKVATARRKLDAAKELNRIHCGGNSASWAK